MIGRIIDSVNNFLIKQKSIYYSKLVSGCKALISGDVKLSFPENISVGCDTMINGGGHNDICIKKCKNTHRLTLYDFI